jgi:hypothetical protein
VRPGNIRISILYSGKVAQPETQPMFRADDMMIEKGFENIE